ncbi:MAG: hypothetical protein MZV49_06875 [Rhodopseudomonas palustris]|nr:hypothetical protein [Rhodopseudomonas palustris]
MQTELYGDGLMMLQKAGHRHQPPQEGQPWATARPASIMGSRALYDFVHMRTGVQMRPSRLHQLGRDRAQEQPVRLGQHGHGRGPLRQRLGGLHRAAPLLQRGGRPARFRPRAERPHPRRPRSSPCRARTDKGQSKIVKHHPPGISLTACSYDGVVDRHRVGDRRPAGAHGRREGPGRGQHHASALPRRVPQGASTTIPCSPSPSGCPSRKLPRGVTLYQGSISLPDA